MAKVKAEEAPRAENPEKKPRAINTLEKMKVEYVKANSIGPNEYNPNRQEPHEFEMLCKSICEDGFTQPVVLHEESNKIVDGEHRWTAWIVVNVLKSMGIDLKVKKITPTISRNISEFRLNRTRVCPPNLEIPVVKVSMTYEQMRIATLRHNRARGSENIDLVAAIFKDLENIGAMEHVQESLLISDDDIKRLVEGSPLDSLASENFGEAWAPESAEGQRIEKALETINNTKNNMGTAATDSAIDAQRKRELAIKQAKTEEEKEAAMADAATFRMVMIFTSEEKEAVDAVLGAMPAKALIDVIWPKWEKIKKERAEKEAAEQKEKDAKKAAKAAEKKGSSATVKKP